jgi:hypothetical protein
VLNGFQRFPSAADFKLGAEDGDLVGQLFDDGLIAVDHQDLPGYVRPSLGVQHCVGDMERFARFCHLV